MTHCKREREDGRECPAQWSWIGGLTGPLNKTWHKEMRDFRINPQFEYCCKQWSVMGHNEKKTDTEIKHLVPMSEPHEFKIPRVLIAYGSETGTAEAAAWHLGRALRAVRPMILPLNRVSGLGIVKQQRITHLLVLCSTTGNGQAPTSATEFSPTAIPSNALADTKVATLAFGSSIYPNFCQAGKDVDRMLKKAGCQVLAPISFADEVDGSVETVAQWNKRIRDTICPASLEETIEERMGTSLVPLKYEIKWHGEAAFNWEDFSWPKDESSICVFNQELIVGGDIDKRSTRRIGFEVPPGTCYTTGDHLCVHPLNRIEVVERFAACFQDELMQHEHGMAFSDLETRVHWQLQQSLTVDCIDFGQTYPAQLAFSTPATLGDILQAGVSLTLTEANAADVISVVIDHMAFECPNAELRIFKKLAAMILDHEKDEEYKRAMNEFLDFYPTLVDLLETGECW